MPSTEIPQADWSNDQSPTTESELAKTIYRNHYNDSYDPLLMGRYNKHAAALQIEGLTLSEIAWELTHRDHKVDANMAHAQLCESERDRYKEALAQERECAATQVAEAEEAGSKDNALTLDNLAMVEEQLAIAVEALELIATRREGAEVCIARAALREIAVDEEDDTTQVEEVGA